MTDYTVADTLHIAFSTRAFATGIPTVLAGSPVVSAYEDAGLTQITAGITLGVDHDSVVGLNMLTIVATGANGYESGKDYNLVITTGTVGGVSVVGEVVGRFTLGRSAAAVDLANGTDGLGAIKTDTAAILIDTTGLNGDAMRGTDNAALASVLGALADAAAAGDPTSADTLMQYVKQLVNTLEGTVGIPVYPAAADPANNISLAEAIRAIRDDVTGLAGAAMRGTDGANTTTPLTAAQVNAEVVDVMKTDTVTLPAQIAPPLTPTFEEMISWLYKTLRNRKDQTSTLWQLYADNETTVDSKATVSDDGTTAIKQEIVSGP